MCMQPPAGGDNTHTCTQGRTSLVEVLEEHLVTIIPFLSTGAEHFGQGLVDSCSRSNEARSHLPLRDASSSTTKS